MTRAIGRLALATALLTSACATPTMPPKVAEAPAKRVPAAPLRETPLAPAALVAYLQALAQAFDGKVGIAVEDVENGWTASYDGAALYPQQSVAKLWVALTVFDAVDRGRMALAEPVVVGLGDMSVFNQPIQKLMVNGAYPTTVDGLLVLAIAQSDNAANDLILRKVGGALAVARAIDERRLGAIRASPEERLLESKIAGLDWRSEYSFGQAFWTARDRVPTDVRAAKLRAYVGDPDDGAAPNAIVNGLAKLKRGELLSAGSTARFLQILDETTTGPLRLKAGLGPGWTIAHKTGTGQDLGDLTTGYNDVGLITAPDGHSYAVAVMIAQTRRPVPERQTLMASVAQAVVMQHDRTLGDYTPPAPTPTPTPASTPTPVRR